jgi:hypothetical protein
MDYRKEQLNNSSVPKNSGILRSLLKYERGWAKKEKTPKISQGLFRELEF